MVRIVNHSHMLEITCYVAIKRVLSFFGNFAHKVDQTWFVFHKIWHTTLFSRCYYAEVVRFKNYSDMLEFTF